MSKMRPTTADTIKCPECGGGALYTRYEQTASFLTGEMEDDGIPAIETLTSTDGYTIKCASCDYEDGEPCTF